MPFPQGIYFPFSGGNNKEPMDIQEQKNILRRELLQKIRSYSPEELARRSKNVTQNLKTLPQYKQANCIMFYYPLETEVNLLGTIREALRQKRVCFPVIDLKNGDLIPYEINDLNKDFATGPWGITQPSKERARKTELQDIDLVVVPGVAFDKTKNRLGRGKGFYDKFLQKLGGKTANVGIAFDFQVIRHVPSYPHKYEKVDALVTESFCI